MIKLVVHPHTSVGQDFFDVKEGHAPRSIALDGYVSGPPRVLIRDDLVRINFDHHAGVQRMATRSTSGQVQVALKLGLRELMNAGEPFHVYVNDCDQDTCLAVWMLKNPDRVVSGEPLLNRLVWAEDMLDATGGAYPLDPDGNLMREIAWVFEPYEEVRVEVGIANLDARQIKNVINTVGLRIDNLLMGKGDVRTLDTRFFRAGGDDTWALVHEIGTNARTGMFRAGVRAFVAVSRMDNTNRFLYKMGRLSPFVRFPLPDIYAALNEAEKNEADPWGGSDLVGGGPRRGSTLTPSQVESVVNLVLKNK